MRKLLLVALLGALAVSTAHAAPPALSLQRLAVGGEAAAKWVKDQPDLSFIPSAWASYSITSNLSASVNQGYNVEAKAWEPGRAGLRMYVPQEPVRVALGVNYLKDWKAEDHSWSVGLYAGWHLHGRLAAAASIEKDVPRDETSYRVAVRALALGGR